MLQVITNYPIAIDSDDHKYPEGIYYDNNSNQAFIADVEKYFNDHISILDLGCAGGQLVCDMHQKGHVAVGLEGSDHCLNVRPQTVDEVGMLPYGHQNWKTYGNKILFTCDITKDYQIYDCDRPMKFDLITCWDVMEHFEPNAVPKFVELVKNHLKPNGIYVATIALFSSGRHQLSKNTPHGLEYHKSLFPKEWWLNQLAPQLQSIPYPFMCCNRSYIDPFGSGGYLVYAGKIP